MRRENGITLVALIITIIILVILAAVSVAAVYNMGIVNYAVNGTQEYARRAIEENKIMDSTTSLIDSALGKINNIQEESEDFDITKGRWALTWNDMDDPEYYFKFYKNGKCIINQSGMSQFPYEFDGTTLVIKDWLGGAQNYEYSSGTFSDEYGSITPIAASPVTFTIDGEEYEAESGMWLSE